MEKFKQYVPAIIGLLGLVMLLFIAAGNDAPMAADPTQTDPVSQTAEGTAPTDRETVPEETRAKDALTRVEQALDRYSLDETAMAVCIYDGSLHAGDDTTGAGRDAHAHALARVCDEQKMNPIAAFWLLEDQELYEYAPAREENIGVPAFSLPLQVRREYEFTAQGTRDLLTDILTYAGTVEDGLDMEARMLGENGIVDADQIFYRKGDCYYSYFIYYGDRSAHFFCFYTRGGEKIDDVEFQLLNLRYASGDGEQLNRIDQFGDRQAASLMAAAEQLLTGSSKADEGRIAHSYSVDGSAVTIERFEIIGDAETGKLTNYDIHIEG